MQLGRGELMLGLAVAAAEFGSLSARASRYDLGAPPVRYPDADIKTIDPRFSSLVLGNAAIERIATGCRFTEGPVWFGDGRYLLWSDIPNDRIMKWDEGDRRGQRLPQAVELRQRQYPRSPGAVDHLRDGFAAADPHRI